ncbi:unnamed protein product [Caenorhabditis bovis]|uniref:GATOR complex protein NPRL3 n=1 Tax=Caenorhabditis bovis TaxID=2654633 RepID=A0A8S1F3G4_9PELO|nr:unnamed protein product [Caenorhabditis bovis]
MTTNHKSAECAATCVMFMTSGVSGEKLHFMHPYRVQEKPKEDKDSELPPSFYSQFNHPSNAKTKKPVLAEIPDDTGKIMTEFTLTTDLLGQALNVDRSSCNKPFELKIDNYRFVAWPKKWKARSNAIFHISIVFAIRANSESYSVEAYQRLSKKLAVAFIALQQSEGFIEEQQKIMDDIDHDAKNPFEKIRQKSKLARTLVDVYEDVIRTGNIHKYVNNLIEIGFCDEAYSLSLASVMPKGRSEIEKIVRSIRPYHGILLLEDIGPTPDANPSVARLIRHCSPDRSILDMSTASGIPVLEVFMIVRHLLLWTRAILIYPLCNTNVYTSATSPQPLETMIEKFAQQFGANIHLAAGLAHFNPPATLGSFVRSNLPLSEQHVRAKLVVMLLKHQMLMQLHVFFYIIKPYSNAKCPRPGRHCPEALRNMISRSTIDVNVQSIVADICGQMLETESLSQVEEKLSNFIAMAPYMNGNHHLEDIKYQLNLSRNVCENVITSFQLVIAKILRPDFISE